MMQFVKTSVEDFAILKNGIDERLEIIQHIDSGFYNITKAAKMINELSSSENEPAKILAGSVKNIKQINELSSFENEPTGIPAGSKIKDKRINHWFENDSTKRLLSECKYQTHLDCVNYELAKGTPKKFAGTYVHKLLFHHFLAWLNEKYAIRISIILDELDKKANQKIIKEKDDKIDELKNEVDELKAMMKTSLEQTSHIINQNDDLKGEVSQLNIKLDVMTERFDGAISTLVHMTATPEVLTTLISKFAGGKVSFPITSPHKGIGSVKIMYLFAYIRKDYSAIRVQTCARNFDEAPKWMATMADRVKEDKEYIYRIDAIAICDKEVNLERNMTGIAFKESITKIGSNRYKQYTIPTTDKDSAEVLYSKIVSSLRNKFIMEHQDTISNVIMDETITDEARRRAQLAYDYGINFNNNVLIKTQNYLDCFIVRNEEGIITHILTKSKINRKGVAKGLQCASGNDGKKRMDLHLFRLYQLKRYIASYDIEGYLREMIDTSSDEE